MSVIEHEAHAHRFATVVDSRRAVLEYVLADNVMTITHTEVPPAIGGRGIAAELMRAALNVAHAAGWAVNPACSYAAAYMRRHPDTAERQHQDELLDEALEETFPASDPVSVGGST